MDYELKVAELKKQFSEIKNRRNLSLKAKSTTHILRNRSKDGRVDIRRFDQVVRIDRERKLVIVEGSAKFYDIAKATLTEGFVPQVVPELRSITLGGTISGLGLESSSFRYGIVQDTVEDLDVLVASGEVIRCSRVTHADLFNALPNSFGSLGYVVRASLRLVEALEYVCVEIKRYADPMTYQQALVMCCESGEWDFIDGAIFSSTNYVLVLGKKVKAVPEKTHVFNLKRGRFYDRIKNIPDKSLMYFTTLDYLFRWDTDAFWGIESYPVLKFFFEKTLLRRTILSPLLRSDRLLKLKKYRDTVVESTLNVLKLLGITYRNYEELIQDIGIAPEELPDYMNWYLRTINFFPVWICPLRKTVASKTYPLFDQKAPLILDFGFYGRIFTEHSDPHRFLKLLESKLTRDNNMKGLYSKNLYSEEDFWSLYDKQLYLKIKKTYDPFNTFPNVYEKISR